MDRELERLDEQLRLALEGPAWHGPAVLEVLADVSAEEASSHPIEGAHSIWELTLHLAGDYRLVLRRLEGNDAKVSPEEDWPVVPPPTAEQWAARVQELRDLNQALRRAVRDFAPGRLDSPLVADPPYTAYTQFIGVTQHGLYHAGQMALLKKAARPSRDR